MAKRIRPDKGQLQPELRITIHKSCMRTGVTGIVLGKPFEQGEETLQKLRMPDGSERALPYALLDIATEAQVEKYLQERRVATRIP